MDTRVGTGTGTAMRTQGQQQGALGPPRAPTRSSGAGSRALLLLVGFLLLTCGPDVQRAGSSDGVSGQLVALSIQPGNDVLLVDLGQRAQKPFTVQGYLADGRGIDLTDQVTLTLSNPSLGEFRGGMFVSASRSDPKVDFAQVEAKLGSGGTALSTLANLTVVWLRQSGPSPDFFYLLPYEEPGQGTPQEKPLSFSTYLQSLDAFFAVDTTASMGPSIRALLQALVGTILPGVKAVAQKEAWFGVGAVEDFALSPHGQAACNRDGSADDQPFQLLSPMTKDLAAAQAAVGNLLLRNQPRGCGGDIPEAQLEALYQLATGKGLVGAGANIPARTQGKGGASFRDGALPVITLLTDASFHVKDEAARLCPYIDVMGMMGTSSTLYSPQVAAVAHTRAETTAALGSLCAKVIGVAPQLSGADACLPGYDLLQLARSTGAMVPPEAWDVPSRPLGCGQGLCCTGLAGAGQPPDPDGLCPLVFAVDSSGTGLGQQVTSGIAQLARFASFSVLVDKAGVPQSDEGVPLPAGKTSADFLTAILAASAEAPPAPPTLPVAQVSGDGQSFVRVYPGSIVRFRVLAQNHLVRAQARPLTYRVSLRVRAGGCADLDQREVLIVVPPYAPPIG